MISSTSSRYFIKDGYSENPPRTFDADETRDYWTGKRLRLNGSYQYYVYQHARRLMKVHGLSSLLDVGSGPAVKVRELLAPICDDITLVDQPNSEELATGNLPKAKFIASDLEVIDKDLGRQFDLVICADVLEHLGDPTCCTDFIAKHLTKNGLAVISTPERDIVRGPSAMKSGNPVHVREWNATEFHRFIESRGLDIVDHQFLPLQRLSAKDAVIHRFCPSMLTAPKWRGCQTVIAKRKGI